MSDDIECFINMVINSMSVSDKKLEEIKVETEKDDKQFIREGWPKNKYDIPNKIYEYCNCKYEPTESKGFVLKGEKIVIPTSLRDEMLRRQHESHLGIEKTKKLARDFMYWPARFKWTDF